MTLRLRLVRKLFAFLLSTLIFLNPSQVWSALETEVRVYVFRPAVFADTFIGPALPADLSALGNRLWYIQLDDYPRLQAGPDGLADFVRRHGVRGVDFSRCKLLSTSELEQFLRF